MNVANHLKDKITQLSSVQNPQQPPRAVRGSCYHIYMQRDALYTRIVCYLLVWIGIWPRNRSIGAFTCILGVLSKSRIAIQRRLWSDVLVYNELDSYTKRNPDNNVHSIDIVILPG